MIITRDGWLEQDARQYEQQQEIEAEYQNACDCEESQSANGAVTAHWRSTRTWRGWVITCDYCCAVVDELDGEG